MFRVFVTGEIPEVGLEKLKEFCEVEINREIYPLPKKRMIEKLKDKNALCCTGHDVIDREVITSTPSLKVISTFAVGYDNIDLLAATEKGILVTNTPGVLNQAVVELTLGLMFCVARRIVEADKYIRSRGFEEGYKLNLFIGVELKGKTLGIVGAGKIGSEVALRAKTLGMEAIYYDLVSNKFLEEQGVKRTELEYLLKKADFVSIHVPLTENTRHLIGEKEIGLMKKTAYLINTSRGPVVDEKALIKFLRERKIAGAALDVFENEPFIPDGLMKLENIVLTPHIGSASQEARDKMSLLVAENCLAALQGKVPPNLLNKEVIEKWG